MNDKPTINPKTLPPLTRFIYTLGQLPTSYLMSMSFEEQLVWLCNYLGTQVIPAVNQNGAAVEELQNLYELLRTYVNESIESQNEYINNYFDNLDVQNEIDHKLDEMVEDGTITNLIETYINPVIETKLSDKVQVASLGIEAGTLTEEDVDLINTYIEEHPYCSLEFGKGEYTLPKSIILLQGSSISGIGNDTKLIAPTGSWAIICKGLTTINSTTEIYNLTIDGNFLGNGIYIDGTRYSRCEIHDVFVVACLYGIRNAKPTVANVYDDNFGIGNGGNNIHDVYIYGETPNDDTSSCLNGLVLNANDNFITNVRVSGYGNYGVYINGSGNQFTNLKSAVNHIGMFMAGGQNTGSICAEECFQNNFELSYVRNSTLNLKTASAGCVVAESLPTDLAYYDVSIVHCSNNNININGFVAQSFTYRKAGELAMLYLQDSILNNINVYYGNSQVPNEYSLPIISNCAFANNIKINNQDYNKFINYTLLEDLTAIQPSNITLTGDYPDYDITYSGTSASTNFIAFDLTDYIDNDLFIFMNSFQTYPAQSYQLSYKFTEETGAHNYNSSMQFICSYGQNGAIGFPINIKDVLETQADYINGIQLGYTLQYARIYLKCTHAEAGDSKHHIDIAVID